MIDPDEHNGLSAVSAAQCQHIRSIATTRVISRIGNVGPAMLRHVRSVVAIVIDA